MADLGIARPQELQGSVPGRMDPAQAVGRVQQAENETERRGERPGAAEAVPVSDEGTVDVAVLTEHVERLNREAKDYHLRFEVEQSSGRITVHIVDVETGEVLRTVPPSAVLKLGEHLGGEAGLFVNATV